jgi:hypothetical protein
MTAKPVVIGTSEQIFSLHLVVVITVVEISVSVVVEVVSVGGTEVVRGQKVVYSVTTP